MIEQIPKKFFQPTTLVICTIFGTASVSQAQVPSGTIVAWEEDGESSVEFNLSVTGVTPTIVPEPASALGLLIASILSFSTITKTGRPRSDS